jgi:hypothetical protein
MWAFLSIVLDGVLQALVVIGLELGWFTVRSPFGRREAAPVALALVGLLLIGGAAGGISLWGWPNRLTAPGPLPGASLVISPLVNGLAMDALGRWRAKRGWPPEHVSTFWGGAAFAFGVAIVRFWFVPAVTPLAGLPLER